MDISIIILNYKTSGLVLQAIKTLLLYPTKAKMEIIVVDNNSGDSIGERLATKFPGVKFIQTGENLGFAGGNNRGIEAATGRYITIMNPDITVRPGSVDELVAFMDAHLEVGIAGPKLVRPNGSLDESCFRYPTRGIPVYRRTPLGKTPKGKAAIADYVMEDFDRNATREVDWLLGAMLIVRRAALEEVGMMDERYFMYFEDTDWCRRFRAAGWKVMYVTESVMVHFHERWSAQGAWLTSPFRKSTRIHLSSYAKYFWKWRHEDAVTETA